MTSACFKFHYSWIEPQIVHYRNYKNFNQTLFLEDLEKSNFLLNSQNPNDMFEFLLETLLKFVNKHAVLKNLILRGNNLPYINKEIRQSIDLDWEISFEKIVRLNEKLYINIYVSCRWKCIRFYLISVTKNKVASNKTFWKFIKPSLTNKNCHMQNYITLDPW